MSSQSGGDFREYPLARLDGRGEENVSSGSSKELLLVTAPVAAKMLSISPRTLWSLSAAGEIPSVRFGRNVRYSIEALRTWIAKRQERATEDI